MDGWLLWVGSDVSCIALTSLFFPLLCFLLFAFFYPLLEVRWQSQRHVYLYRISET